MLPLYVLRHNLSLLWLKRSSSGEENSNSRVNANLENQSAQVAALATAGSNIEVVVDSSAHDVDESVLVHLSHRDLRLDTKNLHRVSFIRFSYNTRQSQRSLERIKLSARQPLMKNNVPLQQPKQPTTQNRSVATTVLGESWTPSRSASCPPRPWH